MDSGVASYVRGIHKYAILTREEEKQLGDRYRDPNASQASRDKARELLINHNLRFALKQAHRYARQYNQSLDDLIQIANEGLIWAADRFDPSRGYRFISFAVHWIIAKLRNYCLVNVSIVKYGTTAAQRKLFYKVRYFYGDIKAREPELSDDDIFARIAKKTKTEIADVRDAYHRLSAAGSDVSLQRSVEGLDFAYGATFQDLLESENVDLDEKIDLEDRKRRIASVARSVARNARDTFFIERRLLSNNPMTLERIGSNFKNRHGNAVSRERMRQVQEIIYNRIRGVMAV